MQPWPPWAMKPSAVASSPESCTKSVPSAARCWLTRPMLAVILHPYDVVELGQPRHGVDRHVDHAAPGDVVDDNRNVGAVVDRLVVQIEPILRGLVVIRRDHLHP